MVILSYTAPVAGIAHGWHSNLFSATPILGFKQPFLRHSSRFCPKIAGIPTRFLSCLTQNCANRLFFGLKKPFDANPLWRVAENKFLLLFLK